MNPRYLKTHRSRELTRSILFVSKKIVEIISISNREKLNDVFINVQNELAINDKDFMLALNFLFTLNIVEYEKQFDTLVYQK